MAKLYCLGVGSMFVLVGIVGSITGGHDHALGLLGTNFYHNLVRLIVGFLAFGAAAAGERHSRMFCLESAGLFSVLAVASLERFAGAGAVLHLAAGDLWLYSALAGASLVLGLSSKVALRLRNAIDSQPTLHV